MWIVRLALRRPFTVAVLSLLILIGGWLSSQRMKSDMLPVIDIPVVIVVWNYPGLSAEDMERRIVFISERAYSTTVAGIQISSRSRSPASASSRSTSSRAPTSAAPSRRWWRSR